MKIFDWVHRKFRQNNGQSVNKSEVGTGQRVSHGNPREERKSGYACAWSSEAAAARVAAASDMTGLLAIGTFGMQAVAEELEVVHECQEFLKAVERVDSEITAGEVELLYDQLDKTFSLKSTTANNNRRSSSGSSTENNVVYPLHEFLHSPALPDTHARANNKKESRTSLGDLFSNPNPNQESRPVPKDDHIFTQNLQKIPKPSKDASKPGSLSFVKKILKRNTANSSVSGLETGRKLDKVIRVFHNRIHPEETAGSKEEKSSRKEKKRFSCIQLLPCTRPSDTKEENDAVAGETMGGAPYCTQEHWIKTDADYVVLEL